MGHLEEVKAYYGGWEQGDPIKIVITRYDTATEAPIDSGWDVTVWDEDAIKIYKKQTWFVDDSIFSTMSGLGCSNLINISGYTDSNPLVIYLSETRWLKIYYASSGSGSISKGFHIDHYIGTAKQDYGIGTSGTSKNNAWALWSIPPEGVSPSNTSTYHFKFWKLSDDGFQVSQSRRSPATTLNTFYTGVIHKPYSPLPPDPYSSHKPSDIHNQSGGNWDDTNDDINVPDAPDINVVDTGFISLYSPTKLQMNTLASYMWSNNFYDSIVKLWGDPMDAILGLSIIPTTVPTSGLGTVKVGNVDTNVTMSKISSQYVDVDCGTLTINEYYGSYLDYSPYTKFELMLPFIGVHAIDPDTVIGKAVNIKYRIDVLSGACICFVKCGGSVIYQFTGNCAVNVPITSQSFSNMALTIATMVGSSAFSIASGSSGGIAMGEGLGVTLARGVGDAVMDAGQSAISNIGNMKPDILKSGSLGSSLSLMGIKKPYYIITRPNLCAPENQNHYTGFPSFVYMSLGDCSGLTIVNSVHLDGIGGTDTELDMIETYLKTGVVL